MNYGWIADVVRGGLKDAYGFSLEVRRNQALKEIELERAKQLRSYAENGVNSQLPTSENGIDLMKIGMILGGFLFLVVLLVLFKGNNDKAPQVQYVPQVVGQGNVRV